MAEQLLETISVYDFPLIDHMTVSIGLIELQADDRCESFIKRMDIALCQAKGGCRNSVEFC